MKTAPTTYKGRFSTCGRFTIPAPLRRKYGLKAGSPLAIEVTPTGAFVLKPFGARLP